MNTLSSVFQNLNIRCTLLLHACDHASVLPTEFFLFRVNFQKRLHGSHSVSLSFSLAAHNSPIITSYHVPFRPPKITKFSRPTQIDDCSLRLPGWIWFPDPYPELQGHRSTQYGYSLPIGWVRRSLWKEHQLRWPNQVPNPPFKS